MKNNRGYKVTIIVLILAIGVLLFLFRDDLRNKFANKGKATPTVVAVAPQPTAQPKPAASEQPAPKPTTPHRKVKKSDDGSAQREADEAQVKQQADAQAKADEKANADAQAKADADQKARDEQAKRDAAERQRQEEQAKRDAQRRADEQARLDAERRAEEQTKPVQPSYPTEYRELVSIIDSFIAELDEALKGLDFFQDRAESFKNGYDETVTCKKLTTLSSKDDVRSIYKKLTAAKKTTLSALKRTADGLKKGPKSEMTKALYGSTVSLFQEVELTPEKDSQEIGKWGKAFFAIPPFFLASLATGGTTDQMFNNCPTTKSNVQLMETRAHLLSWKAAIRKK